MEKYNRKRGKTKGDIANIEYVEHKFKKIILKTGTKKYRFGGVMTNAEREWLIGETKDWLGI